MLSTLGCVQLLGDSISAEGSGYYENVRAILSTVSRNSHMTAYAMVSAESTVFVRTTCDVQSHLTTLRPEINCLTE